MIKKIKHIIVGIALIGMGLLGIPSSQAIDVIMGVTGACPTSNANCFPFPGSVAAVCTAVLNQATCPRFFHPSWSNGNQLWGVSSTNAAACVRSTDIGLTWAACTAQAFVPIQQLIAEASDGTLVAVADVAGTCTVKTSPDNAVTWNTVFTNPGIGCGVGSGGAQTLYCQSTGGQCDFGFGTGATTRTYRSTNNGANWTVNTIGDVQQSIAYNIEMGSALIGGFGGNIGIGGKATFETAGLFQVSAAWPASATNYFGAYAFMFGGAVQYINNDNGTNVWKRTDVDGNVLQSITPPTSQGAAGLNPMLRPLNWSGSIYYLVGGTATGIGVWVSTDSMVSTVLLFNRTGNPGPTTTGWTMYKVGSRVLISGNDGGAIGFFLRIS